MDDQQLAIRLKVALKIVRGVVVVAFFAFFLFFGWLFIQPDGQLTVSFKPHPNESSTGWFQDFASKEPYRLIGKLRSGMGDYFQDITIDPVYFDIPAFRSWETAKVTAWYENPDEQPTLALGVQQPGGGYYFQPMASYDTRLEALLPYWESIRDGDRILWQKNKPAFEEYQKLKHGLEEQNRKYRDLVEENNRDDLVEQENGQGLRPVNIQERLSSFPFNDYKTTKVYSSIDDFFQHPPDSSTVVRFQVEVPGSASFPGYRPATQRREFTVGLRGTHTLVTYVSEKEDLDFTFFLSDINRHHDDDQLTLTITHGTQEVEKIVVPDDGITDATNTVLAPREYRLQIPEPGQGVYRIAIETTDDTFITSMTTAQRYVFFEGRLYLTDNEEYRSIFPQKNFQATILYTNGSTVSAQTPHDDGLQTLTFGKLKLPLRDLNKKITVSDLGVLTKITVPKNDVVFEGGSFAFTPEDFFLSHIIDPPTIDKIEKPLDEYDFIIARYQTAQQDNRLLKASAQVPSGKLNKVGRVYKFILHAPELRENGRRLRIYAVEVQFQRPPLTTENFFPRIGGFLRRSFQQLFKKL